MDAASLGPACQKKINVDSLAAGRRTNPGPTNVYRQRIERRVYPRPDHVIGLLTVIDRNQRNSEVRAPTFPQSCRRLNQANLVITMLRWGF